MTIKGVLFDASGTLLRIESAQSWLRGVLDDRGIEASQAAAWQLYPDTLDVLRRLREQDVRIAVVSNVGWNWRPVFDAHGLTPYIDANVFSYEVGVDKPDPRIFQLACDRLGVDPAEALMVGDEQHKDGGAEAIGCRYLPVEHLPVESRPEGLRAVIEMVV
ncbi:HAD-IA family hydrolase [[Kitasatospora] papulosa]|uniref:HAD-IA family hydrolase n=1 Tax=[Kitasatospora] papulosa TaxID=1464011 RepID=UPI0036E32759